MFLLTRYNLHAKRFAANINAFLIHDGTRSAALGIEIHIYHIITEKSESQKRKSDIDSSHLSLVISAN